MNTETKKLITKAFKVGFQCGLLVGKTTERLNIFLSDLEEIRKNVKHRKREASF